MLNFDRSTVKHGTQNIQNDCHQWLSDRFWVQLIRFRPELRPGPHSGSLQRSPDPLPWFKRPILLRGGEGKVKGREEGEKKGTGGTDPPFANSWIRPCSSLYTLTLFLFLMQKTWQHATLSTLVHMVAYCRGKLSCSALSCKWISSGWS